MLDPRILICSAAEAIQYLRWYVKILFKILKNTGIFVQPLAISFFFPHVITLVMWINAHKIRFSFLVLLLVKR